MFGLILPFLSSGLQAQLTWPECQTVSSSRRQWYMPPPVKRWQGRFADTVAYRLIYGKGLDALYAKDPVQVTWSVAMLATDPTRSTRDLARDAASWYRNHIGRARPILALLEGTGDQAFRPTALEAIKPPLSLDEERLVFRYACDASWQLEALWADSAYHRMVNKGAAHVAWPADAMSVLYASSVLLTGSRRAAVDSMILRFRE